MKTRKTQPTLQDLADHLGASVHGDGRVRIKSIAPIQAAGEGDLTFVTGAKYLPAAAASPAAEVLIDQTPPVDIHKPLLIHPNPYACLARLIGYFHPPTQARPGIRRGAWVEKGARVHKSAVVYPGASVRAGAKIGARTVLHPGTYVGENSVLGEDCLLYPNVVVREDCVLGNRVILQPGVVIGSDGFGFAKEGEGYLKIPQVGNVVLEDDVEIGAGSAVDRAVLGTTKIGKGTKLDNLVHIGHNCVVGKHTVIAGQSGMAGSTQVGDHCAFGGQVGVAGHLKIGDHVTLATRAGVMENIPEAGVYWGAPSAPMKEEMKNVAAYRNLPSLVRRVRHLEKALKRLDPSFTKDDPEGGKP